MTNVNKTIRTFLGLDILNRVIFILFLFLISIFCFKKKIVYITIFYLLFLLVAFVQTFFSKSLKAGYIFCFLVTIGFSFFSDYYQVSEVFMALTLIICISTAKCFVDDTKKAEIDLTIFFYIVFFVLALASYFFLDSSDYPVGTTLFDYSDLWFVVNLIFGG